MKIKVDTTGVETQPAAIKPGLYTVKVTDIEAKDSAKGKPMLAVIFEISGGEYDGRTLYDYIMLDDDSMAWKLASFQDALGIPRKGTIDTDKLVGKKCQVRTVVQKSEEYGEQARIRNILSLKKGKSDDEDLDDDEDDDESEEQDYSEMSIKELKKEVKERELEPDKTSKKGLIEALEEDDEEDDEDEEDEDAEEEEDEDEESEDEDDEDEDEDEQDYDEWDLADLKKECKERSLKSTGKKSQLVARLEKDDAKGEDGEPF